MGPFYQRNEENFRLLFKTTLLLKITNINFIGANVPCTLTSDQSPPPSPSAIINSFLRKVKAVSGALGQNSDTVPLNSIFMYVLGILGEF